MLTNIHIQNFRCFEDFKAEGFERINLIGGKNNSGKTCLLEGILALRHNFLDNESLLIEIASLRDEKIEDLINQNLKDGLKYLGEINIKGNENDNYVAYSYPKKVTKDINFYEIRLEVFYISLTKSLPAIDFNKSFYKIENEDKTEEYIKLLSKIDNSITKIRTIGLDGNIPKIKQTHNKTFIKLSSYGDAVKSIMRYVTPLFDKMIFDDKPLFNYILLIDEIENGIHYTAHQDFWHKMFVLAKELNVQIFATTHSLEMIQAFNKVAVAFEKDNPKDKGAYFEMMRNVRTNKITAQKYTEIELEYSLENQKTFRGE